MPLGLPKLIRRSTPSNSIYYDAEGNPSTGVVSPAMSPKAEQGDKSAVAHDSGVDVTRGNPSTTVQSPITGSALHRGSVIRDRDEPNATKAQPQPTQNNQSKSNQVEPKGKQVGDEPSLQSLPIYYNESKGNFQAVDADGEVGRSDSQKSNKSPRFAANGGDDSAAADKLAKSQSWRSRSGLDRTGSRISRLSARLSAQDVVAPGPNAQVGDVSGAFAMGAAMSAPDSEIHDELSHGFQERANAAEENLTRKQSSKIKKNEHTFSRKIAKIIQGEARTEQRALDAAIKELSEIQKMQQAAVKEESRTYTFHTKSLHNLHSRELALIKAQSDLERAQADIEARLAKIQIEFKKSKARAQAQYDRAQADVEKARAEVKAQEDHREASTKHALETTDWVKEKRKEVEVLRGWMGVDEREREAKLSELRA